MILLSSVKHITISWIPSTTCIPTTYNKILEPSRIYFFIIYFFIWLFNGKTLMCQWKTLTFQWKNLDVLMKKKIGVMPWTLFLVMSVHYFHEYSTHTNPWDSKLLNKNKENNFFFGDTRFPYTIACSYIRYLG